MQTIIINATASKNSGALSILKEFVLYMENDIEKGKYAIHLFTVKDCFDSLKHITVHKFPVQNWIARMKWDNGGLRAYCKAKGIFPDLIISMQNTSSLFDGNMPQLVYYHQTLPLIKYKWKWFRRSEIKMCLYAHFYKYFVRMNNRTATYVVQLPSIKSSFLEKIKNVSEERVFVIRPEKPGIDVSKIIPLKKADAIVRFLYPATPHPYKNHKVIIDAVESMTGEDRKKIEVIFTVEKDSFVGREVKKRGLEGTIACIGMKPQEELFSIYKSSDCLLFPSKIESFGLPLDEAACFGLPVIASNLPFAREVLYGYENARFARPNDFSEWKKLMVEAMGYSKCEMKIERNNSWQKFFDIAERLVS